MNYTTHSENLEGIRVNVEKEFPLQLISAEVEILKVKKADDTVEVNLYKEKIYALAQTSLWN